MNRSFFAATTSMCSVTAVVKSDTLHKTVPTSFLPQEHHTTRKGLIPGHNTPTPKESDHSPPTMGTNMGDISTDHKQTTILITRGGSSSYRRNISCSPSSHHRGSCYLLADRCPITTHAITHLTGIVTPISNIPLMSLTPLFHRL